ncbi:NAD(P)-binding protein [Lentibacillus jeotgali]|uniref:NAD(P)-binding protein n=1 Tax=Lentibacillus jeotgali TaxID=558169 RepID=UPI000262806E|nr:NAD(P)-binding protein [Lentibacillus jeotgali]
MAGIPLMIDLTDKHVIVVGGGAVAERRIRATLEGGANLTVISPEITEGIHSLWLDGDLTWRKKRVAPGDLADAFLVIAATNDVQVNQSIVQASPSNALINDASDAEKGDLAFPSFFKRGLLSISVSTNGASPMLAAKIKQDLQAAYDNSYTDYVDFLYECRKQLKQSALSKHEQRLILQAILSDKFLNKEHQQKGLDWLAGLAERGYTR